MNRLYNFRYLPLSGPISGSDVLSQTERAFNELGATSLEALDVANNAVSIAGKAANDAISAITTANEALAMATNASHNAQNAVATANSALGKAQQALSYANDAIDTAQQALSASDTALTTANNALAAANRAQSAANAAQETANSALGAANTANIMALANEEALNVSLHFQHPSPDSVLAIDELYTSYRYIIIDPKTPGLPVEEAGFLTIRTEAEALSESETETEALIDEEVDDFHVHKTVQHFLTLQGVQYVRIGTATVDAKEETASIVWDEWVLPKPASHASETLEYGIGNETLFGHVKLSDATGSSEDATSGIAATPLAVKNAFDLAQQAIDTKQNTLTFDAVPTTSSPHPVTSGGVKAAIESAISTVYKWKGSVESLADLPAQGNETGDVYNVRSSGANYGWTGTEWDNLGGIEAVDATPVKDSAFPVASGGVFDALATKQNNLVFDASPAADSANPVTSSGIRAAIDAIPEQVNADWQATEGKALVLNKPTTLAGFGITDAASKTELATGLANKQDTLVFDETPTAGSAHSVTSGAVRAAIDSVFGDLDTILEEILS